MNENLNEKKVPVSQNNPEATWVSSEKIELADDDFFHPWTFSFRRSADNNKLILLSKREKVGGMTGCFQILF